MFSNIKDIVEVVSLAIVAVALLIFGIQKIIQLMKMPAAQRQEIIRKTLYSLVCDAAKNFGEVDEDSITTKVIAKFYEDYPDFSKTLTKEQLYSLILQALESFKSDLDSSAALQNYTGIKRS